MKSSGQEIEVGGGALELADPLASSDMPAPIVPSARGIGEHGGPNCASCGICWGWVGGCCITIGVACDACALSIVAISICGAVSGVARCRCGICLVGWVTTYCGGPIGVA